jgi:hypothetical protein
LKRVDTLCDRPSDDLSESDDDNADSESYSDFEPEIARNIKKLCTMCLVIQKVGVPRNRTVMIKVRYMQGSCGLQHGKNKSLFQT